MKSFIRLTAALLLTVCIGALPPALVFAADFREVPAQSAAQGDGQSKVTPDPRPVVESAADTGTWEQK